ncbi:hypothetical protein PI126_g24339, partial [Phytophthora idaei]
MLPDLPSVGPAPHAVPPSTAAAAAACEDTVVAAAQDDRAAVRAAVEHRARAEPDQDHATTARARAEPIQVDATSSRDSRSSKDDAATVPATYAHDAAQFACALCQYVAESMAVLVSHRRSAHRGTRFQDTFTSGCACSLVFYARIVATSHAAACARRQQRAVPPAPTHVLPTRTEAALLPTGPPTAAMTVTAAVASSDTVVAAATNLQSAVPAAPKPHEHQHAPPVLEPSPVQRSACAASKRRRLNSSATTAPCMPSVRVQDADAQAAQRSGTEAVQQHAVEGSAQLLEKQGAAVADQPSPPQRTSTRWGPRPRPRPQTEQPAVTSEQAAALAARRPLTSAAPGIGATRWGPSHRAIGAAAIARLVTGLPTAPAQPTRRPPPTLPTPPALPVQQEATVAVVVDGGPAEDTTWLLRFDGACRRNPG